MEKLFKSNATSCEEKITKSVKILRFLSKIVGFDILENDFHLTWLSCWVIFDCGSYIFVNAYNVLEFWGSTTQVCFCLVTWSFGFQVRQLFGKSSNHL